jgi:type II secretory pathway component PulM
MQTPPSHETQEKRHIFGTHIGDLGLVLIAFLCTVIVFLILFSPSPADRLQKAQARQEKERILKENTERQRKIDEAVATGEVSVGITPHKH